MIQVATVDICAISTIINLMDQCFRATFFAQFRFPGGATDAHLTNPSASFPLDGAAAEPHTSGGRWRRERRSPVHDYND